METSSIKAQITKHIKTTMGSSNPRMSGWYVGITNNEKRRKAEHKRDKGEILFWKCINASTMKKANEVEQYFSNNGTMNLPSPNGAVTNSRWVYVFKLPTNQKMGLGGVISKNKLYNQIFGE